MTQSEAILNTYKEIVSYLDQPYYVLEGLSNSIRDNQILHSSPTIKQITGLSQFDLARNSRLFFDSIHPDYIDDYIESNKRLIAGIHIDSRQYLIKHQITGEYIPVQELATSRLNSDKNYFEIYCSVKRTDINSYPTSELSKFISKEASESARGPENHFQQLMHAANYLVDQMAHHFKMNAVRFYGYDSGSKTLYNIADSQNKRYQHRLETLTGAKVKGLVPLFSEDSLFYQYLLSRNCSIIDNQKDIIEIVKCHSDSAILKKMAPAAVKIYRVKSFGILPVICPKGDIVGAITFGAPKHYDDQTKRHIIDYATTNSFVLTPTLCKCFDQP